MTGVTTGVMTGVRKCMDRFLVLITTTDQRHAEQVCAALEDANIPVMLEHVEIHDGTLRASGYRLLVPSQYSQTARRLADLQSSVAHLTHHKRSGALAAGGVRPLGSGPIPVGRFIQ